MSGYPPPNPNMFVFMKIQMALTVLATGSAELSRTPQAHASSCLISHNPHNNSKTLELIISFTRMRKPSVKRQVNSPATISEDAVKPEFEPRFALV